jgi:hypothetical protein
MIPRGVLYVATGRKYLDEAVRSARSVKACMPGIHATLFTDASDVIDPCFDEIRRLENPRYSYIDKIAPLKDSPYERTLFLDTDTCVCVSCDELFTLLDRFEIAAAHDTDRGPVVPGCPDAFVEINSGVMAYRNTPAVHRLFDRWLATYRAQLTDAVPTPNDQTAFRRVLYESGVSFYALPSEYNYTLWHPGFVGARGVVKILHGRSSTIARTAPWINASDKARVFVPSLAFVDGRTFGILSRRGWPLTRLVGWCVRALRRIRGFPSGRVPTAS